MNHDLSILDQMPIEEYLPDQCQSMMKYALGAGLVVPASLMKQYSVLVSSLAQPGTLASTSASTHIHEWMTLHERLTKIVKPTKPRAIHLMEKESQKKSFFKILGPISLIRRIMAVTIISLVLLIIISLSPAIDPKPENWDHIHSTGWSLLLRSAYLLIASGLGASFLLLFKANRHLSEGTFDPTYETSYWTRFILGVLSGFLLATEIPIERSMHSDFAKPLLAVLGGFSADVVFQILTRLVGAVKSLLESDLHTILESKRKQSEANTAVENNLSRFRMAIEILKIQEQITPDSKPEEIKNQLRKLSESFLSDWDNHNRDEKINHITEEKSDSPSVLAAQAEQ